MGSGHFPQEGDKRAAYFQQIKIFNSKGHAERPLLSALDRSVDRPDCYKASTIYIFKKGSYMFYYGGPGGCLD
uniref:Neprosin PEP catalytic domain-containing protein n=1 Tax=Leersia perrieri TaxID=77586 RepID=A0A0D9XER3_9ORYZ